MQLDAKLFSPLRFGRLVAKNRIWLAPLTRCRAAAGGVPGPFAAEYYSQRASGGLLITEATSIMPGAVGYPDVPGIHDDAQVAGWRKVTDAVHAKGGLIQCQLWHVGRVAHPSFGGSEPVGPSAVVAKGKTHTPKGSEPFVVPRALTEAEIGALTAQFRLAAEHVIRAGFDGVQIHAANGYLIDQFLRDGTNRRTDRYGGSIENRARFLLEIVDAVSAAVGADRVSVRLSPTGTFNDMVDSDPRATFGHVVKALSGRGLAFLEIREAGADDLRHGGEAIPMSYFRPLFDGVLVANTGFTAETAERCLQDGAADAVTFGVPFLANPDLPARFRSGAPLNPPDPSSFYGGGAKGYVDYPAMDAAASR